MLTVDRRVGRLVEARFAGNPTETDVAEWGRAADYCLKTCLARTQKIAVCFTDMRASALFRPGVTDELISVMRKDNKLVERNALLGIGGATFTLQLQRLLREASAGSEVRRRVFVDPEEAFAWLDELLVPVERARVREFVEEFAPPVAEVGRSFEHSRIATPAAAQRSRPAQSSPEPKYRAAPPSQPESQRPPAPAEGQPESSDRPGRGPKGGGRF